MKVTKILRSHNACQTLYYTNTGIVIPFPYHTHREVKETADTIEEGVEFMFRSADYYDELIECHGDYEQVGPATAPTFYRTYFMVVLSGGFLGGMSVNAELVVWNDGKVIGYETEEEAMELLEKMQTLFPEKKYFILPVEVKIGG